MTTEEAIKILENGSWWDNLNPDASDADMNPLHEALDVAISALRAQQEAEKEEGRYRFYYCESEDSYLLGARVDNFYYAHWDGKSFVWDMSRHLPWGEHVVRPETAWKEHTFPSEPKGIGPEEWFRGFLDQRFRQESEKNEPLTLDELREMDGEPVWIVEYPDWGHWELSEDAKDYFEEREQDFYGMKHDDPMGCYGLHKLGWLAYRHKPKEG